MDTYSVYVVYALLLPANGKCHQSVTHWNEMYTFPITNPVPFDCLCNCKLNSVHKHARTKNDSNVEKNRNTWQKFIHMHKHTWKYKKCAHWRSPYFVYICILSWAEQKKQQQQHNLYKPIELKQDSLHSATGRIKSTPNCLVSHAAKLMVANTPHIQLRLEMLDGKWFSIPVYLKCVFRSGCSRYASHVCVRVSACPENIDVEWQALRCSIPKLYLLLLNQGTGKTKYVWASDACPNVDHEKNPIMWLIPKKDIKAYFFFG